MARDRSDLQEDPGIYGNNLEGTDAVDLHNDFRFRPFEMAHCFEDQSQLKNA
jgi:hypothetical protein